MNTPNQTPHVVATPPTLPATLWDPSCAARFAAPQGSGSPVVGVGTTDGREGRRIDPAGAGEVETCEAWISDFWAVPGIRTACGRHTGHPAPHWPVRMAGDPE